MRLTPVLKATLTLALACGCAAIGGSSALSAENALVPFSHEPGAKTESDWNHTVLPEIFFGIVSALE